MKLESYKFGFMSQFKAFQISIEPKKLVEPIPQLLESCKASIWKIQSPILYFIKLDILFESADILLLPRNLEEKKAKCPKELLFDSRILGYIYAPLLIKLECVS